MSQVGGFYHTPLQFKPYQHSPLPTPTSIRLLSFVNLENCLRAVSFDGAPVLEIQLEVVDLDSNPDFNCLSYTWGNWKETGPYHYNGYQDGVRLPVIVNGQLLYITRNLHDALWQFGPWGQWHVDGRFKPYNKTELIRAAEEGQSRAVQRLIEKGASLHYQDTFGETALHYAAENGHLPTVEVLLRYGAEVNVVDHSGRTPRDCCLQRKRGEWPKVADALATHSPSMPPVSTQSAALYPLKTRLWADAICVDQRNLSERASQVALMSCIYSSAKSVLVWLGPSDENTQSAWEILTYLASETNEPRPKCSIIAGREYESTIACMQLFHRRWFWRRWVIQEMALARELQVFCGSFEFDWQKISLTILGHHIAITDAPTLDDPAYTGSTRVFGANNSSMTPFALAYVRSQIQSRSHPGRYLPFNSDGQPNDESLGAFKLSLPILLILSWHFATTEPRDRIYGLLGVVEPVENKTPIIPDYTKSVSELYTEVGKLFVEAAGNHQVQNYETGAVQSFEPLEGLSFVQGTSCGRHVFDPLHPSCECVMTRLPSWVPDFSGPLATRRIHRDRFCASTRHSVKFYPSRPDAIKLDACCIDHIVDAENDPVRTRPRHGEAIRFFEPLSWLEMTAKFDVTSPTGQDRAEVLWRTLMVDDVTEDPEITKSDFKKFLCEDFARHKMSFWRRKKYMSLLERLHHTDTSGSLPSPTELNQFCKTYDTSKHGQLITCNDEGSFRWKFAQVVRKRGLLRTKGGLMGFGPRWTMPGDEVWLLAGARTPFVLRPLTGSGDVGCYRMIGEAYVHGVMYGEKCSDQDMKFGPIEIR